MNKNTTNYKQKKPSNNKKQSCLDYIISNTNKNENNPSSFQSTQRHAPMPLSLVLHSGFNIKFEAETVLDGTSLAVNDFDTPKIRTF